MPAAANTTQHSDFVPTVDISPFLRDPSSPLVDGIVDEVRRACVKTGFFQITGHGVPHDILARLFDASKKFFALPVEEKTRLDARKQIGRRGYDVLESQSYHVDTPADLKEGFYVGHDLSPDNPAVQARRFYMGPNVWPDQTLLGSYDFREPVEKYFAVVNDLALKVLNLIALTLPYGPTVFSDFSYGDVVAALRLLRYPPAPAIDGNGGQLGAGEHSDFSAITLLVQDGNPGLEVLDAETNKFVPVAATPTALIVNVGDMLSVLTRLANK
ncbi:Acyl-CoA N-acyltransferase [Purpureocillium lavendulum]|uniref:Acyl-CoA N-acyltransferase n=1 Tax=Purpureocillium lavendulum TaxID=1247861 RepID=A0AB34FNS5_9HYPO|nr:Acyl-CoA N-acyltransferase [Purpureocillium lavendulum]